MASDRTVAAGFDMAAERSGSATAGSTPDRQRPFVSDQDRLSLGLVAFLFWTVGVQTVYDYFRRWSYKGSGRRYLDRLNQRERRLNGRAPTPSAGVDRRTNPTIKTATQGKTTD